MKIDLIGMILNNARPGAFDGVIIDDAGKELDAVQSLDHMIMEYAKVKNGGVSSTVAVRYVDRKGEPFRDQVQKWNDLQVKAKDAQVRGDEPQSRMLLQQATLIEQQLEQSGASIRQLVCP